MKGNNMKTKLFFIAYCLWCVGFAIFSGYHCIRCAVANNVAFSIINGVCSVGDIVCLVMFTHTIKGERK